MRITDYQFYKQAVADKWLILFVLLLLITLSLFMLGYLPYPYGFFIFSAAIIARLSSIVMLK